MCQARPLRGRSFRGIWRLGNRQSAMGMPPSASKPACILRHGLPRPDSSGVIAGLMRPDLAAFGRSPPASGHGSSGSRRHPARKGHAGRRSVRGNPSDCADAGTSSTRQTHLDTFVSPVWLMGATLPATGQARPALGARLAPGAGHRGKPASVTGHPLGTLSHDLPVGRPRRPNQRAGRMKDGSAGASLRSQRRGGGRCPSRTGPRHRVRTGRGRWGTSRTHAASGSWAGPCSRR